MLFCEQFFVDIFTIGKQLVKREQSNELTFYLLISFQVVVVIVQILNYENKGLILKRVLSLIVQLVFRPIICFDLKDRNESAPTNRC